MLHRRMIRSVMMLLGLTLVPAALAGAQDPVTKPTTSPTLGTGGRLPQPKNLTAVQLPDGRIRVTWSRVPDATSYAIVRSVPPDPQRPVTPNVTDTIYFDNQVTAGKTYYYVISGANDVATGLRAGTPPVLARRSYDPSWRPPTVTNVVATYDRSANRVNVTWQGPSLDVRYFIRVNGVLQAYTPSRPPFVFSPSPGARLRFEVSAQDDFGMQSPWVASNEILIDSVKVEPTSPEAAPSITGPAGTIAVTIGSAITMRVGASASAASTLGGASATRWVSLDDGIATVDGSGTLSARAAGRARVLAITGGADGSVRVTLVQVTINP